MGTKYSETKDTKYSQTRGTKYSKTTDAKYSETISIDAELIFPFLINFTAPLCALVISSVLS